MYPSIHHLTILVQAIHININLIISGSPTQTNTDSIIEVVYSDTDGVSSKSYISCEGLTDLLIFKTVND